MTVCTQNFHAQIRSAKEKLFGQSQNQIIILPHLFYSQRQISLNYVIYTTHK